jgi:predicted Fe-S protein YdhL (DUF1289 family)
MNRAAATVGAVASPCTSVCTMDAACRLCIGCFRTLDEIAEWSVMDDDARRGVLAALPARRAASAGRAEGSR